MQLEEHGTLKQYRRGCRCETCRAANAKYQRDYQTARKAKLAKASEVSDDPTAAQS